jgi:hopene-associated glycosyltransferase HpnB
MMLLWLTCAAAAIWVGIALAPWRPWSTVERLEALADDAPRLDLSNVTALIPARNEATLIETTLTALLQQGNGLRIIVVDDQSTDGTADAARRATAGTCDIVVGTAVPPGWVGKLWALEQGLMRVQTPLTLLLDADIELRPGTVAALIARLKADGRQLVSLMAVLEMHTAWEHLLVPAFVYFFKLLYPFRLSNARGGPVAAAAGGCVLVETAALVKIGGLESIRDALIDDCSLARRIKDTGGRTWIGLTHAAVSRRRMETLGDIWRMVARSAYAQLRYSVALLSGCILLLAVAFWTPVAGLLIGGSIAREASAIALVAMALTYIPTLLFYRRSPLWAMALPFTGTLYMLMTISSATRYWLGAGSEWKSRRYHRARS